MVLSFKSRVKKVNEFFHWIIIWFDICSNCWCCFRIYVEEYEYGVKQVNYRSCEIFVPDQSSVFYHAVKNVINDVNNESYQYDLSDKYDIQILKYRKGGQYEWHIDYGVCWHPGLDRKLSISIQLSNESQYEGGELEIRDWKGDNITAPKRLGSAIVFDSRVTHRAKPVTEGERIVLVGWASGPKLR